MDDNCAICLELLSSKQTHELDCGHSFHTGCQVEWFRRGQTTCPTCRKDNGETKIRLRRNQSAFQIMSARARRKDAPSGLKKLWKKYTKLIENEKIQQKEIRDFKHKEGKFGEMHTQFNALSRRRWNIQRRIRRMKYEISQLCEVIPVFVR